MGHTKGPWKDDISPFGATRRIYEMVGGERGRIIANVAGEIDEVKDNARLISSAPELLTVLNRNLAVSSCDGLSCKSNGGADYCVYCDTRAAIARATGKE
jgi:hypothetical protein